MSDGSNAGATEPSQGQSFKHIALLNLAILAGALVLIEGLASTALFVRDMIKAAPLAEGRHTRYDATLGWVNIPGVAIPDMYAPGLSVRINRQGFRNDRDFATAVPEGKKRVICAGDSFTFGYGVDNSQPWCELLAKQDPRFETVNMGQGGYGVDQAYLWYKRDGVKLAHDVVLLAFITLDFQRMQQKEFLGYPKPLYAIENGKLKLTNVPVPEPGSLLRWLNQRREAVRELRSFQVLQKVMARTGKPQPSSKDEAAERVAEEIFAEFAQTAREHHSTPILVYLPFSRTAEDDDLRWQSAVRDIAQRRGIALIDLVGLFDSLEPTERAAMFIPEGAISYRGATGHYTAKGNEYVAQALLERMRPSLTSSTSPEQQ